MKLGGRMMAVILSACMGAGLAGCGGPVGPDGSGEGPAQTAAAETATAETTAAEAAAPQETSSLKGESATTGTASSTGATASRTTRTAGPSTGTTTVSTQAAASTGSSATAPSPAVSENEVEFIGRFADRGNGVYAFEWSGSTITAGFVGTGIAVELKTVRTAGNTEDYLNISVDGEAPRVLTVREGQERYVLAEGLPRGYHTVRLTKRTEAQFASLLEFHGFDYLDGQAAPAPARKTRRIEVYGDSISAGYGNEGSEPGFRLEEENAEKTYGMLAAGELDAECTIIALSGHGCFTGLGGRSDILSRYMDQTLYKERGKYRGRTDPDVVVVNLGTNDYAMQVDSGDFYTAYVDFIAALRRTYPKAYIVCMAGGGTNAHIDVLGRVEDLFRRQRKDNRVVRFVAAYEDINGTQGADGHPSVYGHEQLAGQLADFLREQLGW